MKQLDVNEYMALVGRQARTASRGMARAGTAQKNRALLHIAAAVRRDAAKLKEINARDVERARANGQDAAFIDRLTLTDRAIDTMAAGLEQIAALPDPIGEISNMKFRPTGIQVGQMRVPLGVIGIIYESRPNVTVDAAALCIKSGNATILRAVPKRSNRTARWRRSSRKAWPRLASPPTPCRLWPLRTARPSAS